jgi:hypothetical protein
MVKIEKICIPSPIQNGQFGPAAQKPAITGQNLTCQAIKPAIKKPI